MSCPSWSRLVAHRYAGPDQPEPREPDGWREALEHLDSCPACREAAYAADPTLVLRRHGVAPFDGDEVSRMRAGVDALRRAQRVVEHSPTRRARRGDGARHGLSRWSAFAPSATRLAAAAGLAAVLLSVHPHDGQMSGVPSPAPAVQPELQALVPSSAIDDWGGDLGDLAATDDFYRSTLTVYRFDEDDLDVVMLVGSELDV